MRSVISYKLLLKCFCVSLSLYLHECVCFIPDLIASDDHILCLQFYFAVYILVKIYTGTRMHWDRFRLIGGIILHIWQAIWPSVVNQHPIPFSYLCPRYCTHLECSRWERGDSCQILFLQFNTYWHVLYSKFISRQNSKICDFFIYWIEYIG